MPEAHNPACRCTGGAKRSERQAAKLLQKLKDNNNQKVINTRFAFIYQHILD
jgi:RNase adaptor protein for sRNA GlmZ degradation